MKADLKAQQIVEYLLVFTTVTLVIFGVSKGVGNKVEDVLDKSLNDLKADVYSYSWELGKCTSCVKKCIKTATENPGERSCSYVCRRNDGTQVDASYCEGAVPAAKTVACVLPRCAIDCQWNPWPAVDYTHCDPACGDSRVLTQTRTVAVPAQFGGVKCDPADGSRKLSCPPLKCPGICGNGFVETGEQCDLTNLGDFGSGDCTQTKVESLSQPAVMAAIADAVKNEFVGGVVSCDSCKIDASDCQYKKCNNWVTGACGVNAVDADYPAGCPDGKRRKDQHCYVRTVDDSTEISGLSTDTMKCVDDKSCVFHCKNKMDWSEWCSDPHEERLTQDKQNVAYYPDLASCQALDPNSCFAYCWPGLVPAVDSNGDPTCACPLATKPHYCKDPVTSTWDCHECCVNDDCSGAGEICSNWKCVVPACAVADPLNPEPAKNSEWCKGWDKNLTANPQPIEYGTACPSQDSAACTAVCYAGLVVNATKDGCECPATAPGDFYCSRKDNVAWDDKCHECCEDTDCDVLNGEQCLGYFCCGDGTCQSGEEAFCPDDCPCDFLLETFAGCNACGGSYCEDKTSALGGPSWLTPGEKCEKAIPVPATPTFVPQNCACGADEIPTGTYVSNTFKSSVNCEAGTPEVRQVRVQQGYSCTPANDPNPTACCGDGFVNGAEKCDFDTSPPAATDCNQIGYSISNTTKCIGGSAANVKANKVEDECTYDTTKCKYKCADLSTVDSRAAWCSHYNDGVTSDNQVPTYVAPGSCPVAPNSTACVAECLASKNLTAKADGSGCECNPSTYKYCSTDDNPAWDNVCHECCKDKDCTNSKVCKSYTCTDPACEKLASNATFCSGYDSGITSDGQDITYVNYGTDQNPAANCPAANATCMAFCAKNLVATSDGCKCPNAAEPHYCSDGKCHECCSDADCTSPEMCDTTSDYKCYDRTADCTYCWDQMTECSVCGGTECCPKDPATGHSYFATCEQMHSGLASGMAHGLCNCPPGEIPDAPVYSDGAYVVHSGDGNNDYGIDCFNVTTHNYDCVPYVPQYANPAHPAPIDNPCCGDGIVNGAEQCDPNATDVYNSKDCEDYGGYAGTGSGPLKCDATTCQVDASSCPKCGDADHNIDTLYGEVCDGSNLDSKDCSDINGVSAGAGLACAADCQSFDTDGCYMCGDGGEPAGGAVWCGNYLTGLTADTPVTYVEDCSPSGFAQCQALCDSAANLKVNAAGDGCEPSCSQYTSSGSGACNGDADCEWVKVKGQCTGDSIRCLNPTTEAACHAANLLGWGCEWVNEYEGCYSKQEPVAMQDGWVINFSGSSCQTLVGTDSANFLNSTSTCNSYYPDGSNLVVRGNCSDCNSGDLCHNNTGLVCGADSVCCDVSVYHY